jgi:hypothetical protein
LRIKIASEVAYLQNAPKQSRPDRDAYPHFETATMSKRIELEISQKDAENELNLSLLS